MFSTYKSNYNLATAMLVVITVILLVYSAISWSAFYDAETEKLTLDNAKNMRVLSIVLTSSSVVLLTAIAMWNLAFHKRGG